MFQRNTCTTLIVIFLESLLLRGSEEICGQPHFKPLLPTEDTVGNRIANGVEAKRHSHPWQALIYKKTPEVLKFCGGSLIDWQEQNASDLVLTAAHCVIDGFESNGTTVWESLTYTVSKIFSGRESTLITNVSDVEVYLGMHIAIRVNSNDKRFRVASMMVGEFNKITKPHDIAVLKLDRMATYSKYVQGVCLPMEDESLPTFSKHCVVVGWGLLANGWPSKRLQQVSANIYKDRIRNLTFNKRRMICTDSKETYASASFGDSGGPLTCMKNGTYFIYGIMSFQFPEHCTDRMDKQAFVKVSHYIKWLNKVIPKLNETRT